MSAREHGTNARYQVDHCRCQPRRTAAAEYERDRRRRRAYGLEAYVDATHAREHVLWLRREGMGLKTIADASGVPHGSLAKLIYGDQQRAMAPSKRVRPQTAVAILTVQPEPADGVPVDSAETVQMLRALVAIGWPQRKLAQIIGITEGALSLVILGKRGTSVGTARRVAGMYDALSMVPGPSSRARDIGAKHGWRSPLAAGSVA